ncbi:MAG: sigma-54 dependent transcriptional regulator [Alphaproteobacteria bacterium]|nr:sigma-54 dependent transcriptional regulator [Alphaproteobacteria bacterium]
MGASVLIVEDDKMQRDMLGLLLRRKLELEADVAENGRVALDILQRDEGRSIKLVILDLNMPVMNGLEALSIIRQRYPALPVIMLTGVKDVESAAQAMKLGASDFISKPYEGERLAVTVRNSLKISVLSREVKRLSEDKSGRFTFENLIGYDGGLKETVFMSRKAAVSDIPVLITGETGVGKEAFAKAMHGESRRAGKPFIAVNCGAIPAQLVESTLFGHEKGSFTGAIDKAIGKFREAEGGTIFLDEVGELPLEAQVKLLRVLQQKEVEPVGAGKPVPIDIRVISATNRNLEEEVAEGRFREDLFFRLNVFEIEVPPLRERTEDIPLLARHFIERHCAAHSEAPYPLSRDAENLLLLHNWPGNVRELENTISRACVMDDDMSLGRDDIERALGRKPFTQATGVVSVAGWGEYLCGVAG